MKVWIEVLLEWLNCLDVSEADIKDLKELDNGTIYKKLIKSFSWSDNVENNVDTENIIVKFLQDEYPKYKFDDKILGEMEHIYVASLFLLRISQEPLFYHPMCINLQHETQLKIKSFLEMTIPHGQNIDREILKEIIVEIENAAVKAPITPKTKSLKDFFNSPATWSAQSHKLLNEKNRELRILKSELEVEKFEKVDLQEDLRIQQNKIQNLEKKLQEKIVEIKALKEEKMKPATPQSCKKKKDIIDYEQYYKKEIDYLENQLIQKQCNIDKLEADNDTLTKKLTSIQTQCMYFKEKVENCEKSLENLQIQGEIKDRELVNLKMTNEELRTHLKEFRKTAIEEQSFEIDGIAPLQSPSVSLNTSEVLSSVIDIQLQEAKQESALLKVQLDATNEKLESVSQEYEDTIQLLKMKTETLQNTETELNATVNELTKQIEILQEEKASLINQNKNLDMLCVSQKKSLSHIEKSKNALIIEKNSLIEKVKDLEESLNKKDINNVTLNTELTKVKSQISENLRYIQELRNQNNLYKDSADLYNINLREIISDNIDYIEDNLENKTTTELIEHLQITLSKFNEKYTLKQLETELLNNDMNEAKLKLENFQLQISKLERKDEQNNTEISKLKETIRENVTKINELTISIEKYTEEISYLKQIKFQKQALEKDLHIYKEKINKKNSLLQASSRCIEMSRKNFQTLETEFYLMKRDVLNQINEYQKYNKETSESILNAYKILFINYTEEQLCKNQLENELTDNKKKLKDNINFNVTLENDLIKLRMESKERMNDLEAELICTKQKLIESTEKLKKFEKTQEVFQKQHEDLKSENEKILLDLNVVNDKLEKSQQEACNMLDELKFKNKKIENLFEEITSLKLEKEHIIHLQTRGEIKMKNFIKELETKLLEKQHHSDQLNIEVKLKQERLELVQNKFEKLSRETIASEMKLKEIIINLQEVRTNQDAVLKTQEKALKEKCLQLEQLQKEFNESKEVFCKQLENKKLLCENLQSINFKLETESCKQIKTIEELQQMLKKEKDELNKSKEYYKAEDIKKLEITQTCEKLQHSVNDLKSTIAETSANIYIDATYNIQNINNDDTNENVLKTIRSSINEINISRKLILQLSNENANLSESLKNQTIIEDNYVSKCEEIKLLKTKVQELNNLYKDRLKNINILIKHKESLKDYLKNTIKSREDLDTSLNRLKQKWDNLLTSSYNILTMDKSVCDELKHIQTKRTYLEKALFKHHIYYLQNIKSLQNILWEQFSWSEQKIKDIWLEEKNEQILDISPDIFLDQKAIIETELHKNKILQENIIQLQNEIDDFSKLVISFENDFKRDETKFQSEAEKKLQLQINELIEDKNNLESKLNCVRIKNAKLENEVGEFSTKVQEIKITSLKEVEDSKKELIQLKEENSKLQEERDELSKRPKKEDVDKQLKDIYDKYKIKVDEIKQNMKTAYNEQITKLNREQEQCVQEKLESLQTKMELQCRKQADELNKYKTHVANMSSQLWTVGEKLLSEKQEKEKLQKELTELKAKYQNLDKKIISLIEHKNAKCEKKNALEENKNVLHNKIAVIQEKTTYERRYSIRNIQTMGNAFNAEDEEGEVFDNIYLADMKDGNFSMSIDTDRLSILKKRNALCKPHLKSSYPAEMQFHPLSFTEEEIKAGSVTDEIFNDSLSQSLLPEQKTKKKDRTQTSYKKPGPPTPSKNGGRLSLQGNELRSPSSRILREKNKERATTTPRTLRNLFLSRGQDEKVIVTPRGRRRSSIFRKHRNANDR